MVKHDAVSNHILGQLSAAEIAPLKLEPVPLEFKETLYEQDRPIQWAHFPISGVVSLVSEMDDTTLTVESGTVGREGMVGIPGFLGARKAPGRAFVQVAGAAFRTEMSVLGSVAHDNEKLSRILLLYTNALMAMVAQSAACNRAHPVEARMARWLLLTHDRVRGDEFPLTQEFIGQMLGVRRPAVNIAGRTLQSAGLIRYSRGKISILDRRGLERAACECYSIVTQQMLWVRG